MDPLVRRALLKPIARRKSRLTTRKRVESALDVLDQRAIAGAYLPEIAKIQKERRQHKSPGSYKDPASAQVSVALATALFFARRISAHEYTFMVASAAEGVNEGRITDDSYPEIVELFSKMRAVEVAHDLDPGEYWTYGEEPDEYVNLNRQFEAATEKRLIETFRELGAEDIASLFIADREEFDRRRERGRRAFFHKDEVLPALTDAVVRYELEARKAAAAGAYTAAIALIGAAVEGLLVLRCLRSKSKALTVAASLTRPKRPRPQEDPTKWKFDTLIETCLAAGWLPTISTTIATFSPAGLAHSLRQMRNYLHPGKVAIERPWVEADEIEYTTAESIYATIFSTVTTTKRLKNLREAASLGQQS